jgi:hypothetical protein
MKSIALAMTWDGARIPTKKLTAKARAFLNGQAPTAKALAKLFSDNEVHELRICWVPQLKGGPDVLAKPFSILDGKRLPFKSIRTTRFGDILGVVYRRLSRSR